MSKTRNIEKLYWFKYNIKLELANFRAHKIWRGFTSIANAEEYINRKVPQSIKNARK